MVLNLNPIDDYELGKETYKINEVVNAALEFNNELLETIITILFDIIKQYCEYSTEEQLLTMRKSFSEYILNIFKDINEYIENFTKITKHQHSINTNMRVSFMKKIDNWIIKNVIENRKFEICV